MKKLLMMLEILMIGGLLMAGCMLETEAERDLRLAGQGATMTADVLGVTATAEAISLQKTAVKITQDLAIVNGILAQTQQAQEVEATRAAQTAEAAAKTQSARDTEAARVEATQAYWANQTAIAAAKTATIEERNARDTEIALHKTETAQVTADYVGAIATQAYLDILQEASLSTQTVLIEGKKSVEASEENKRLAEAATLWFRTWAPRVGWALAGLVAAVLLVYLVIWSWPWIVARLSVHRENGKLVFVFPQKDGWAALIPGLNGQPGATVPDQQGDGRQLTTNGGFDDQTLQNQVAARSQAADVVRALVQSESSAPEINRKAVVRKLMQQGGGTVPQQPAETDGFRILGGAGELPAHLRPDADTLRAMDAEWRELDE